MTSTFYLLTNTGFYKVFARDYHDVKRIYRNLFNLKKMPSGCVISKDRSCGFFKEENKKITATLEGCFK